MTASPRTRAVRWHIDSLHRTKRWPRAIVMTVALIVVLLLAASLVSVPFAAITPGATLNISDLIVLPKAQRHIKAGEVSLVDVDIVSLRAINYLFYRMNANDQVLPTGQLLGPLSNKSYDEQGVLDMASAREAAIYVGLRTLGYRVSALPTSVAVYATLPNSPASGAGSGQLQIGNLIEDLNGKKITNLSTLASRLSSLHPGDLVNLSIGTFGESGRRSIRLRLGAWNGQTTATPRCNAVTSQKRRGDRLLKACMGIMTTQLYRISKLPFPLELNSSGIIGPSAGLAFTLGVMHALDPASLFGGRHVVATGTMALNGDVGDVGGVAQKTVAVRASGATIFFVPKGEYGIAKRHAGTHMTVLPVTTISQVVRDLKAMGGKIIKPSAG